MKKRQRKILIELCDLCNSLGGELDGTSTHELKYKDRQRGLMSCYKIIYAVLTDNPENDQTDLDYENAEQALNYLRSIKDKKYPDKNGRY